jgi:mRNA-degrading endonuclease RelE of RelBE toxin-antitoxin system
MQDEIPSVKVDRSDKFKKDIKKLRKRHDSIEKDIQPLIEQLEAGELPGDRIAENKYPVYKVRVQNRDIRRGKSSGYRVVYYTMTPKAILLTTIYSKSDRSNISNKEIEDIIREYEREIDSPDEMLSGRKTEIVIAEVEPQILFLRRSANEGIDLEENEDELND